MRQQPAKCNRRPNKIRFSAGLGMLAVARPSRLRWNFQQRASRVCQIFQDRVCQPRQCATETVPVCRVDAECRPSGGVSSPTAMAISHQRGRRGGGAHDIVHLAIPAQSWRLPWLEAWLMPVIKCSVASHSRERRWLQVQNAPPLPECVCAGPWKSLVGESQLGSQQQAGVSTRAFCLVFLCSMDRCSGWRAAQGRGALFLLDGPRSAGGH
ncbi:hypothetical protein QBC47DRAFT_10716 [Echria macrotheca]|uniref:Uncharacterized protein n=1 Tax=Echria macrotheca TaxID=438768 RepID=A0AAJ0BMF4_9PEZI|nr:hypothetical protein QBC47DRAFT_10716 [Echria macrotheca]